MGDRAGCDGDYAVRKLNRYQQLAEDALAGEVIGSSAGGEQPKFACFAETRWGNQNVLVKFSARERNAVSERWSDLLIAESIALAVLSAASINASLATAICSEGGQVFLESIRFDCTGIRGRRQIVSLEALQGSMHLRRASGRWSRIGLPGRAL